MRCKDRTNCKGRAKYIIESGEIQIIQNCTINKYEEHNYVQESIIKEKFKNNLVTKIEMKNTLYQKIFFNETYIQYPSLLYNKILLNLVDKYGITKINYSPNQFNAFKSLYNKKIYIYNNIEEKLDNIKLKGKKLMNCKLEYIDKNNKDIEKNFRIYGTKNSMSLLHSDEINQYFTDCTYKCIPADLKMSML